MERLSNLISILQKPELNFARNRADDEPHSWRCLRIPDRQRSGKSKGQFYTPAEVSRIRTQVLEIDKETTSADTNGPAAHLRISGSLLLKVAAQRMRRPAAWRG